MTSTSCLIIKQFVQKYFWSGDDLREEGKQNRIKQTRRDENNAVDGDEQRINRVA
jgi:hypothetical protein